MAALVVLLAGIDGIPMVWDESAYLLRADQTRQWADNLGAGSFSAKALRKGWPATVVEEGHPAGFCWQQLASSYVVGGWHRLDQARFGSIVLAALAVGGVVYRLARQSSWLAAWIAGAALMTQPRLFSHWHFGTLDGPLTALWLLAWAAFSPALLPSKGRIPWFALAWGALLGATVSMKFTGVVAPAVFIAYLALFRPPGTRQVLLWGLPAAVVVFYLLNPTLWHAPLSGPVEYVRRNLAREGFNIPVLFFGRMYNLSHSLPWYNTLLWTFVAVPTGLLLLFLLGLTRLLGPVDSAKNQTPTNLAQRLKLLASRVDPSTALIVLNWSALIVVRALPGAPPHDGLRLFLPAFGFLAVLAGLGGEVLASALLVRFRQPIVALSAPWLLTAGAAFSVYWYHPQGLSYYNLLIGGVAGATQAGMEPTYYWDGLGDAPRHWLLRNTPPNGRVRYNSSSPDNMALLHLWGRLPRPGALSEPFTWYVVQNRPSSLWPEDVWLLQHETPAAMFTIRPPDSGLGPYRLNVALIVVFTADQHARALQAVAAQSAEEP